MIVVIIAGGSGTRLWPLSTPEFPKHLLKIDGNERSLLQNTYDRAKRLTDNIYIVSEASHIDHVKEQLPDLSEEAFICEPGRRGTANCIIAALERIGNNHDPDDPIVSIHADHYLRNVTGFAHTFKIATDISKAHDRIVLVGAEPSYPATAFGYIEKGQILDEESSVFNVESFKEKPDFETARSYLRTNKYLWNCGYFVGSLNTFKNSMKTYSPELYANYEKLVATTPESFKDVYLEFENIAIDYALIEKVPNLLVVPASYDWMDIGSFSDFARVSGIDEDGNHFKGENLEVEEVSNSFIENYEDKPVAVIGLDNCVVINTPQGLLIARKDLSQRVGDVSKKFKK